MIRTCRTGHVYFHFAIHPAPSRPPQCPLPCAGYDYSGFDRAFGLVLTVVFGVSPQKPLAKSIASLFASRLPFFGVKWHH
jgi:hypothetical protein